VDELPTSGAGDECPDDIRIGDIGELSALFGKASDKLSSSLNRLLAVVSEVPGVPRVHVCALEVSHKDLDQVGPVMNPPRWKVLQPSPYRIGQEQRQVTNDEQVIIYAAQLTSQVVVCKPYLRVCFPRVLDDIGQLSKSG
jgi:hypothetical protein